MVKSVMLPTGATLHYAERGSATGAPVVFLNGATEPWRSFEEVLDRLPSAVRALAPALQGSGAEEIVAFMDALALPSAIVVGRSSGAQVARRFAADHPTRVAGLVLMGGSERDLDTPVVMRALAPAAAPILTDGGDRRAGYAFHWEDPDRFAADLVAFIYERH